MTFTVLGNSEFSLSCARALLDSGHKVCALISMPAHLPPLNPADIKGFAKDKGLTFYEIEDINSPATIKLLKNLDADFMLCCWPKIIKREVLDIPRRFCIGSHPTNLPYNRGRHPLHWLIAMGYQETTLSFFKMDEGIDSGPILMQIPFTIESSDHINALNNRMNTVAYEGMKMLVKRLAEDLSYEGEAQDQEKANYWRKRSLHDTILDLRMPADIILREVRSFSLPYPCAKIIFEEHIISICDARIVKTNLSAEGLKRIESGKIINKQTDRIQIKADDSIVELISDDKLPQDLLDAKYIHPPTKYILEWPENLFLKDLSRGAIRG